MAVAAVALGASVVEKHFTLSRAEGGVDSSFSLEPQEMSTLAQETERAWRALGEVLYGPTEAEKKSLIFRRSIYACKDIAAGEEFTKDNLRIIRPGHGAPPRLIQVLIGKRARSYIARGTPVTIEALL